MTLPMELNICSTTDFGNYIMTFPNYYVVGPNIQFFYQHGVKGLFEEGTDLCLRAYPSFAVFARVGGTVIVTACLLHWRAGPPASVGDGPDLQELKEYVMANMMWRPTQDPLVLISEFLDGYYSEGAPFVRCVSCICLACSVRFLHVVRFLTDQLFDARTVYMDTMHAAVDETNFYLHTCCTAAPKGTSKAYLHPMSLITSAQALLAGERATSGEAKKRIIKASMSVLYPILWNWDEVTSFARAESIEWSSVMTPQTKHAAWEHFAGLYNSTGTHMLNNGQGHSGCVGQCPLTWMRDHLFNSSK
eukprot:COSAG02_NODE_1044_length_15004_cov_106.824287_4_plen_304_part_00